MKTIKLILTNFLFKWMFVDYLNVKNGDFLYCRDTNEVFIFSNSNGNPNNLKWYFRLNGFWNYIKTDGCAYCIDSKTFINTREFYKNNIEEATESQKEIYLLAINEMFNLYK